MPYFFNSSYKKTRFAPSPTGFLHRGHVLSAIWVWGMAKITGAEVILRIEDHDLSRCREEHVKSILSDLEWIGFRWDSYSRQSEHPTRYENYLDKLKSTKNVVYGCACNRKSLQNSPFYDGHCQHLGLPIARESGNALRVHLQETQISWTDLRLGTFQETPSKQCGDLMLRDRLGQWTYQFAVTVDDFEEGIDLVVRGEDLVDSTARQIQLSQMLGRRTSPDYLHHSLLYDDAGNKLSKRQLSKSISSERSEGIFPQQLLGSVCKAGGLILEEREVGVEELGSLIHRHIS